MNTKRAAYTVLEQYNMTLILVHFLKSPKYKVSKVRFIPLPKFPSRMLHLIREFDNNTEKTSRCVKPRAQNTIAGTNSQMSFLVQLKLVFFGRSRRSIEEIEILCTFGHQK
jgi:hypothetical protein